MITPEEFPYITGLHVNDCYTYKDFDVKLHEYKPFSHLILTGKNGSGKTTILKELSTLIYGVRDRSLYSTIAINNNMFSIKQIVPEKYLSNELVYYNSDVVHEKYSSIKNDIKLLEYAIPFLTKDLPF